MSEPNSKSGISRRRFLEFSGTAAIASLFSGRAPAEDGGNEIVRAAIYPGIGVARIGNSREGFLIGPEVTEPPVTEAGRSHDSTGAIKRQAARFRIYGLNSQGQVVRELTAHDAKIQWQVHVANKKAAWYRFLAAMDISDASKMKAIRRNSNVQGKARHALIIDPGPRRISGRNTSGESYHFTGGKFQNVPVELGEIRTDEHGRLLVLGGHGKSGSPSNASVYDPNDDGSFNNANGWYDDSSDGPVSARVTINGKLIPVDSAWVVVAPPNYAPDVIGWRTLYDLLVDTYVQKGLLPVPASTSFTKDVLPILQRLSGLQWVNKGFADTYGNGAQFNFNDPKLIAKLNDPADSAARASVIEHFRIPGTGVSDRRLWPMMYGDAYGTFPDSQLNDLSVCDLFTLHLKRWEAGNFVSDWNPNAKPACRTLEDLPLTEQPDMLNKAALHFCLADAFHPGCELTWPMRHTTLFRAPFRIRVRDEKKAEADYGDTLTAETVLKMDGPLYDQGPGDLTKWMALPWQGDTVFCRSGYEPEFDPYLPTFWPARVPNHVLSEDDYATMMNPAVDREIRLAAFNRRQSWIRAMKGSPPDQILQMISEFGRMGIVEARPGIPNDPDFPSLVFVETIPASNGRSKSIPLGAGRAPVHDEDDPIRKAGWEDEEQLNQFRKLFRLRK